MESTNRIEVRAVRAGDFLNGVPEVSNRLAPGRQMMGGDESRVAYLDSVGHHRYVAVDAGEVVGVATLLIETKFIHKGAYVGQIEDVSVHDVYERTGVGRQLVEALKELAREKGCYKVVLFCSDENVPFYEKLGFVIHQNAMRWNCD